jgi:hypothetical protein
MPKWLIGFLFACPVVVIVAGWIIVAGVRRNTEAAAPMPELSAKQPATQVVVGN